MQTAIHNGICGGSENMCAWVCVHVCGAIGKYLKYYKYVCMHVIFTEIACARDGVSSSSNNNNTSVFVAANQYEKRH